MSFPCGLQTVQRAATARSVCDDWGSTANPRTAQLGKLRTRGPHREPENPRTGGFVPALSMHRASSETPNACIAALICFGWGRSKRSVYAEEQYRVSASLEKLAAGFLGLIGGTRTSIQSEPMGRFLRPLHRRPHVATAENFRNAGSSLAFHTPEVFFKAIL